MACQPKDLKGREWRSAWERGRQSERKSAHMQERERERECTQERKRERESTHHAGERKREGDLAPPFICFCPTWACPVQIGLSQECCLF